MVLQLRRNPPKYMIYVRKKWLSGKISRFEGIRESAQTWTADGHSKNTWFIDFSGVQEKAFRGETEGPYSGHRTFQEKAFRGKTERPYLCSILSMSGYTRSTWYPDLIVYLSLFVKCHPSRSAVWIWLNGILSIIFTCWGSMRVRMTRKFHVLDVALMRESTLRYG